MQYGVRGFPCTYVIDREGKIVNRHAGYGDSTPRALEADARRLLGLDEAAR